MKLDITTLEGQAAGSVELDEAIFGLEPRADLLARCVRWQLAKRQAGTHATKGRSDINRTTKKLYKQKGTGNARHGAASAREFRGGGRALGPEPRSHAPRPAETGAAAGGRARLRAGAAQPRPRPAEEGAGAGAAPRAVGEGARRLLDRGGRR